MVIRLTLRLPFQNTYYLIIFVLHFSAVVPHIASIFLEYITVEEATLLMNSVVWKSHKLVSENVSSNAKRDQSANGSHCNDPLDLEEIILKRNNKEPLN